MSEADFLMYLFEVVDDLLYKATKLRMLWDQFKPTPDEVMEAREIMYRYEYVRSKLKKLMPIIYKHVPPAPLKSPDPHQWIRRVIAGCLIMREELAIVLGI